ncbi:alpha/beta hydrolase [Sediminihabitans luteus]|nr:alpha/beta hydrolase [Sediminihabitans luteus]
MRQTSCGEVTVAEAARRAKVSEQSVGNWKRAFLEAGNTGLAAGESGPSTRRCALQGTPRARLFIVTAPMNGWAVDPCLGAPFEARPLGDATLVRSTASPPAPRGVVLHLHGYNDYFFQDHLARAVEAAGFAFFAVDLRRCGRSLREGDVPHYMTDLLDQAGDLSRAARAVRTAHPGLPLVLHAHSTGGLLAALWAHAHRNHGTIDALVLNSPFLDLRSSWLNRTVGTRILDVVGPWSPLAVVGSGPSVYATHQLAANGGRWEFDTHLKRPEGVPIRAGWLRAVRRGQARVARGLEIGVPVLVAHSDSSGSDVETNPHLDAQDTVLDVAQIARLAPRLGADVSTAVIDGGVHDLVLSADGPRAAYLDGTVAWLDRALGGRA